MNSIKLICFFASVITFLEIHIILFRGYLLHWQPYTCVFYTLREFQDLEENT